MVFSEALYVFLQKAETDGRIGPAHISLFLSILVSAGENYTGDFFVIDRVQLMRRAKIHARQTYTKRMQELHHFGYIVYRPSWDGRVGSRVRVVG